VSPKAPANGRRARAARLPARRPAKRAAARPSKRTRPSRPSIGLALAGGGPEGAIYEIGALRALDEAIDGLDLNALDIYVGVSAGAFLSANLANGLTSAQMCRAIVKHEPGEHPFVPETFFTPAIGEWTRRGLAIPRLASESLWQFLRNPRDRSFLDSLTRLSRALPVGVFDNRPIREYLRAIYTIKGRTDDFRELERRLFVVASELESGRSALFGAEGLDHVPISRAVQASSALPGLYPPVEIDGRLYVDGILNHTMHAAVALEAGARLVLCVNPLVPVDVSGGVIDEAHGTEELVERGLPTVLSQTFRTLIHSRLTMGMESHERTFKDADVLLIEPDRDDHRMFFTNIFSFSARRAVCAHAYERTRRDLLARHDQLAPTLARHGLTLRRDVLEERRDLWSGVGLEEGDAPDPRRAPQPTLDRLGAALDRLQAAIDR
jgi:predicted acylesterase/phospholipase RssA